MIDYFWKKRLVFVVIAMFILTSVIPSIMGEGEDYFYANQDIPVSNGGISGSYLNTQSSDDSYEGISERESGGKPSNRYSYLEHKWTFELTGSFTSIGFYIEAYHSFNTEGDDFVFAYSTNDADYTDIVTVTKTSDVDITETFAPTVNKSDSVFDNINKKAKDLGLLVITNSEGNVLLTNSGTTKCNDVLEYGKNILRGNVSHTYSERFSKYILESQSLPKLTKGIWSTNLRIKSESIDECIKRYRPKLIKSSRPLTNSIAKKTVQWESNYRAGQSQSFNITVQGFRESNGDIWEINKLIDVYAPTLYINPMTELLIVGVTFSLSDAGSTTQLQLKRKDVYDKKPSIPKNITPVNSLGWDQLTKHKSGGDVTNLTIGDTVLGQ